jgi:hypothetical protein
MSAISDTDTNTNCFYHPERSSLESCTECRQPICLSCLSQVAGKTVCQNCVNAIRQRVASEMTEGTVAPSTVPPPPPPPHPSAPYMYASTTQENGVYQPYAPPVPYPTHPTEAMGIKHVFGGFGLGFLAGLVGLIAWVAFVYITNFNIALLAVALGWLIGVATTKGAGGRGGNVVAIMSAIMAFFFCGIGFLLFLGDGAQAWDWIFGLLCLFFGVQQAYKTPISAEKSW